MRILTLAGMFALVLTGSAQSQDKKGTSIEVDGLKSVAPAAWKEEAPANAMRVYQFKLPKAEGDDADAELVVFYFKAGSGTIEQNLKRQEAKFEGEDGKKPVIKVEKIKVGTNEATYQDITGTFLSKFPPFDPNAKITKKANYRQLYVIFDGKNGQYYFTIMGPTKTIDKHKADFETFLKKFE